MGRCLIFEAMTFNWTSFFISPFGFSGSLRRLKRTTVLPSISPLQSDSSKGEGKVLVEVRVSVMSAGCGEGIDTVSLSAPTNEIDQSFAWPFAL